MRTGRAEAFSDGVLAIAITLLILEVPIPHADPGKLGEELLGLWPDYLTYAVSFITIGEIWVNHHTLFHRLRAVDRVALFLNLLLLMVVAFLPFPTAVLGRNITDRDNAQAAGVLYGATMWLIAVGFSALWAYVARRPHLLEPRVPRPSRRTVIRFAAGTVGYSASVPLALLSPLAALGLWFVLAVYYMVEHAPAAERSAAVVSDE